MTLSDPTAGFVAQYHAAQEKVREANATAERLSCLVNEVAERLRKWRSKPFKDLRRVVHSLANPELIPVVMTSAWPTANQLREAMTEYNLRYWELFAAAGRLNQTGELETEIAPDAFIKELPYASAGTPLATESSTPEGDAFIEMATKTGTAIINVDRIAMLYHDAKADEWRLHMSGTSNTACLAIAAEDAEKLKTLLVGNDVARNGAEPGVQGTLHIQYVRKSQFSEML